MGNFFGIIINEFTLNEKSRLLKKFMLDSFWTLHREPFSEIFQIQVILGHLSLFLTVKCDNVFSIKVFAYIDLKLRSIVQNSLK